MSAPLRQSGARVAELVPAHRVAERVGGRTVACALLPSYAEEASWIADSMLAAWRSAAGLPEALAGEIPLEKRPTSAVLVRLRSQIAPIEEALRARGLPVEVVGLGGLLDTPEVRDVVCTLRVLADPTDGASLLRLLTGARWRIGPRDLVALHRRSRAIAAARAAGTNVDEPDEVVADRLDDASLVEAMADLGAPQQYSAEGYPRLRAYSRELFALRQRLDQPLPDLVADIERTIGLDVEVAVRGWGAGDAGLARGHLDALGDVAARYAAETDGGTIAGLLAFLAAAEEEERGLAPGQVDVVEGAVQILTAHAAKGLEWDVVAVAGLAKGVWPGLTRGSDHYLGGMGVLPFPLRGDADGLPVFDLGTAHDQKDVLAALTAFTRAWREHDEREERRLAYVAVTRPRRLLLASGYWWGDGVKRPRGPSVFLDEIRATCTAGAGSVDHWSPEPPADATNPNADSVATAEWPMDPLGPRRPAMAAAADLIRRILTTGDPEAATTFADLATQNPEVATHAAEAADLISAPEGTPIPAPRREAAGSAGSAEIAASAGGATTGARGAGPEELVGGNAQAEAVGREAGGAVPAQAGPSLDEVAGRGVPAQTGPPGVAGQAGAGVPMQASPAAAGAGDHAPLGSPGPAGSGGPRVGAGEPGTEVDPVIARWRREAALLLAEREERTQHDGPTEVAVPPHLSVSQLVVLRRDPQALARSLRRPLPQRPAPFARRGTAFHAWLEQRFGSIRLLDLDELPGAADDEAAPDEELAALQQAFLESEWAARTPKEVEVPFATTVAGVVIRGRMDAVYEDPGNRYDVIDWKTGRRPEGQAAEAAAIQLAAYRIAWSSLAGVPPSRVRAGFHYVKEGVTVRPADLLDADQLAQLIEEIPARFPA